MGPTTYPLINGGSSNIRNASLAMTSTWFFCGYGAPQAATNVSETFSTFIISLHVVYELVDLSLSSSFHKSPKDFKPLSSHDKSRTPVMLKHVQTHFVCTFESSQVVQMSEGSGYYVHQLFGLQMDKLLDICNLWCYVGQRNSRWWSI